MDRFPSIAHFFLTVLAIAMLVSPARGATATFTPVGATQVEIGASISFQITVSVATLSGFNTADIIVGADIAGDITFTYDPQWVAAFASVTTPQYDVGFYGQSVFIGGNNPASVGTSMPLGTVTVQTSGMLPGAYQLDISHLVDGFSTLGLNGNSDPLSGSVAFSVTQPVPSISQWGLVVMTLVLLTLGSILLRQSAA